MLPEYRAPLCRIRAAIISLVHSAPASSRPTLPASPSHVLSHIMTSPIASEKGTDLHVASAQGQLKATLVVLEGLLDTLTETTNSAQALRATVETTRQGSRCRRRVLALEGRNQGHVGRRVGTDDGRAIRTVRPQARRVDSGRPGRLSLDEPGRAPDVPTAALVARTPRSGGCVVALKFTPRHAIRLRRRGGRPHGVADARRAADPRPDRDEATPQRTRSQPERGARREGSLHRRAQRTRRADRGAARQADGPLAAARRRSVPRRSDSRHRQDRRSRRGACGSPAS